MTAHAVNRKEKIQSQPFRLSTAKYMIIAGARPNVIASTSESSSDPKRDPVPVECVADAAEHDIETGGVEFAARRGNDREHSEEQARQGEPVRKNDHAAVSRAFDFRSGVMTAGMIRRQRHFGSPPRTV